MIASDQPTMTPDERYEQAALAQIGERRNRPRHFVLLGGVVFLIALIVVIFAWTKQGRASADLSKRERDLATLVNLTSEWIALSETEASTEDEDRRIPESRVRELASRAGMAKQPPLAKRNIDNYKDARRARYRYDVSDESLGALMTWVDLVLSEFGGAWVHEIELKPSGNTWQLQVVFARWERTST